MVDSYRDELKNRPGQYSRGTYLAASWVLVGGGVVLLVVAALIYHLGGDLIVYAPFGGLSAWLVYSGVKMLNKLHNCC